MVFLMWDKIEQQLKLKGWSMYRLAKESGVHTSNFSNLKAGRLKEMSWTNMCKIADALEVSLDEFRKEKDEPKTENLDRSCERATVQP
jgi:transcriptional regulator with XRE-family HTH domain